MSETLLRETPKNIVWVGGRGNSGVAKVILRDGQQVALKIYSVLGTHNRYRSEQDSLTRLTGLGEARTPRALGGSDKLAIGFTTWLDGKSISNPDPKDLQQVLDFASRLHRWRNEDCFREFHFASAAGLSGGNLERQIRIRRDLLRRDEQLHPKLLRFLENDFSKVLDEVLFWARNAFDFDLPLSPDEMTLSPSDFGFHNCIKDRKGDIYFLDFEYFGFDDPAKLVGDFLLHPGMNLLDDMQKQWVKRCREIYGFEGINRLGHIWGLLGLIWCLILLNEFRSDHRARRDTSGRSLDATSHERVDLKLRRAVDRLKTVQFHYKTPPL